MKFIILDGVVVTSVECSLGQPWYVVACQCPEIQKKNVKKCVAPVLENLKRGKRRGGGLPAEGFRTFVEAFIWCQKERVGCLLRKTRNNGLTFFFPF